MDCVACGSAKMTERPERTAQSYRRFRCQTCGAAVQRALWHRSEPRPVSIGHGRAERGYNIPTLLARDGICTSQAATADSIGDAVEQGESARHC